MQLPQIKVLKKFVRILAFWALVVSVFKLNAQRHETTVASLPASHGKAVRIKPDSDTQNSGSMGLLEQLASDQIVRDTQFLGRTRFDVDLHNHTYFYDPAPASANFVLAKDDPYEPPLEALIRIKALRRDFLAAVPNDDFWLAPLESAEVVVNACVHDLEAPKVDKSTSDAQECSGRIKAQFGKLTESISRFASDHKLSPSEALRRRDPAEGYSVQIKIEPPRARVRVMPLLEYKKDQYFKVPTSSYRWNDLLDSESKLIGWYHYRAEWPSDLNGLEEGDFNITKSGEMTFRPPQKVTN